MKERPFLAQPHEVRAIRAGENAVLRRLVMHRSEVVPADREIVAGTYPSGAAAWFALWPHSHGPRRALDCPAGDPGDRLWVRETWFRAGTGAVFYRADGHTLAEDCGWRPSSHMPRSASRFTLETVDARVERLQDITEDDARMSGVADNQLAVEPGRNLRRMPCSSCGRRWMQHVGSVNVCPGSAGRTFNASTYRGGFAFMWDGINGKRAPWFSNPWVWRVRVRRV